MLDWRRRTRALDRSRRPRSLQHELAFVRIDGHRVTGHEPALEDRQRERIDQPLLDHALERPRAVGRVVAEIPEQRPGGVGQADLDLPLTHPRDQPRDLEVDDLAELLAGEDVELDDVVEAVDELRLELGLHARPDRPGCWRS